MKKSFSIPPSQPQHNDDLHFFYTGAIHSSVKLRSSVKFSSVTQPCPTLWDPMDCCMPGLPIHHQLPELAQTHVHWVSDAFQPSHLCCALLFPPSIFPSIRVFSNETVLRIRWPNYWSCSFSISPSNEYSGLNSFRMDWLDLLAVQRTLKSLFQHHSSKASILWCSVVFIVHSHTHTWLLEKPELTSCMLNLLQSCGLFETIWTI